MLKPKPLGTVERDIIQHGRVVRIHLSASSRGPFESERAYASRMSLLEAHWKRQGIVFADDTQHTREADIARMALDVVRKFLPTDRRHLPLFEAVKRGKRQKYPRR